MQVVRHPYHHADRLVAGDIPPGIEGGGGLAGSDAGGRADGDVVVRVESGRPALGHVNEGANVGFRNRISTREHRHLGELLPGHIICGPKIAVGIAADDAAGGEIEDGRIVGVGRGHVREADRVGEGERHQRDQQGGRDNGDHAYAHEEPTAKRPGE